MRKPFERSITGQYLTELEDMNKIASKVAKELCEKYPDVDIIDIEFLFERAFTHAMTMEELTYGMEVDKENRIT